MDTTTATTADSEVKTSDILDAVLNMRESLKNRGPFASEVWFIDRDAEYWLFMQQVKEDRLPQGFGALNPAYGVRLFRSRIADFFEAPPERRLAMRVFQCMRGMWIVMSDGTVMQVGV